MSMRRWAAGFNHYILSTNAPIHPFSRVERRFGREVCVDLSGMGALDFERIVLNSPIQIERLKLEPQRGAPTALRRRAIYGTYRALHAYPPLTELLSVTITFIGRKRLERGERWEA
jgi:hypothetical protein